MSDVISYTQGGELITRLVNAGLTSKIVQDIIGSRGNKMAKAMMVAILNGQASQPANTERFRLITKKPLKMKVPDTYVHETCMATFAEKHGPDESGRCKDKQIYYLNPNLKDEDFAKTTAKLIPGQELEVDAYQIVGKVSSDECLELAKTGLLVSAQGQAMVYEQLREQLLKGFYYLFFDEEENLSVLDGYRLVPYLYCYSGGDYGLYLDYWDGYWYDFYVVLVVRDCKK